MWSLKPIGANMKKISSFFLICLVMNSCSFSNSSNEVVTSKPSDELEFAVDAIEPSAADIKVEEEKIAELKTPDEISPMEIPDQVAELKRESNAEIKVEEKQIVLPKDEEKELAMVAPEEPKFKDYKETAEKAAVIVREDPKNASLGSEEKYHVQKGDTLMMVAFKIYGDYRKWKELSEWNKVKKINSGMVLRYFVPEQRFGWQPSGLPYLVKTGDTLGIISNEKYGTPKKWKNIYENNRPLIRNPNLIVAGFTLYYIPARDIASERR
jgi:nucleoid-associated protein YgaU